MINRSTPRNRSFLLPGIGICSLLLISCAEQAKHDEEAAPNSPKTENAVNYEDLVKRDGRFFVKFSKDPFSGNSLGEYQGRIEKGQWQGVVMRYREDGTLDHMTEYRDGLRDGRAETWTSHGSLLSISNYKSGERHGLQETWDSYGYKTSSRNYRDGNLHGISTRFSYGQLTFKGNYVDGKEDGDHLTKESVSANESRLTYRLGKVVDGEYESFFSWGREVTRYKDGLLHGLKERFATHRDREQLFAKIPYVEGQIEGTSQRFSIEDGRQIVSSEYRNGKLEGECRVVRHPEQRAYKPSLSSDTITYRFRNGIEIPRTNYSGVYHPCDVRTFRD